MDDTRTKAYLLGSWWMINGCEYQVDRAIITMDGEVRYHLADYGAQFYTEEWLYTRFKRIATRLSLRKKPVFKVQTNHNVHWFDA